jgi:dTDP-4-dehydrorhamnose 3,5-epimerase
MTQPDVARGPHEHEEQSDLFVFFEGTIRLYLWDGRPSSPSFGNRFTADLGADRPASVLVPPGVVHGYKNVGDEPALMVNCPNRLYAGHGKTETVDEIRHEESQESPYHLD